MNIPKPVEVAFMSLLIASLLWVQGIAPQGWESLALGAALAISYWIEQQYNLKP